MKRLCLGALVCAAPLTLSARKIKLEKIEKEIDARNLEEISNLLVRLKKAKNPTPQEMKGIYADLHDYAADRADDLYFKRSAFKNWKDAFRALIGYGSAVGGLGYAVFGPYRYGWSRPVVLRCRFGGGFLSAIGCYLLYKGVQFRTQMGWVGTAKGIQSFFDKKFTLGDGGSDEQTPDNNERNDS